MTKDEWLGAMAVFLWVFVTTFLVAIPFILMNEVACAMRVSNADIQRGFLLGLSYKTINLTGYIFNSFEAKPTFVVAVEVSF